MNKEVFRTKWFSIKEIRNKKCPNELYYGVKPPDYVTAIAYDSNDRIILVEQYRPILNKYCLETPGGQVDNGFTVEDSIKKELIEEIGYTFDEVNQIAVLDPDVGRLMNKLYVYEARKPINRETQIEEGINVKRYTSDEIINLIRNSQISNAFSIAALSLSLKINE